MTSSVVISRVGVDVYIAVSVVSGKEIAGVAVRSGVRLAEHPIVDAKSIMLKIVTAIRRSNN